MISPEMTAMFFGALAGVVVTTAYRLLIGDTASALNELDSSQRKLRGRVGRLEARAASVWKVTTVTSRPAAGAYRTPPDPNTESELPAPASTEQPTVVFDFNEELTCPVCDAGNMMKKNTEGKKTRNSDAHTVCYGCDAYKPPHLHVTCWDCKFKYISKGALEAKECGEETGT